MQNRTLPVKYNLLTVLIFASAVMVYIAGITYSSGYLLLLGTVLEIWCIVRASGKRRSR